MRINETRAHGGGNFEDHLRGASNRDVSRPGEVAPVHYRVSFLYLIRCG
jgi:hypothetical protein